MFGSKAWRTNHYAALFHAVSWSVFIVSATRYDILSLSFVLFLSHCVSISKFLSAMFMYPFLGNACKNNATCIDLNLGYFCACVEGYEGWLCEIESDECRKWRPCENGATCIDLFNDYRQVKVFILKLITARYGIHEVPNRHFYHEIWTIVTYKFA